MKILPNTKQFSIALLIAFITTLTSIPNISSASDLILYVLNLFIGAIVVLIFIRIVMWIGKKMGMDK